MAAWLFSKSAFCRAISAGVQGRELGAEMTGGMILPEPGGRGAGGAGAGTMTTGGGFCPSVRLSFVPKQ